MTDSKKGDSLCASYVFDISYLTKVLGIDFKYILSNDKTTLMFS